MLDDTERAKASLEHAWRYFALHANQRMSMFNYFIVAFGLVSAGLAGSLREEGGLRLVGAALGCALAVVSFVFWKLDQRSSFLIKRAEFALGRAEREVFEKQTLFGDEPAETADAQGLIRLWTYGKAFRVVFWMAAIVGILGSVLALALFLR